MNKNITKSVFAGIMALALAGTANAAEILVGDPAVGSQAADLISTSTTWTANNTYNLQDQIYVMPGATLTIEAGTIVASTPTANGGGSLAVTRGGKIFVQGTEAQPVIMTSKNDNFSTWREAANEWGNLTLMGDALISASHKGKVPNRVVVTGPGPDFRPNTKLPDGLNQRDMEGLTAESTSDTKVWYGGDNDDDDSGSISYLSLRYGGRVVGLTNELNGLSLGGIGRETDIHHVEIMNNVDDGVEIWGGTVNLKYISIWNIGDDSFDLDQGWRGKAQFIFIVQGYSLDADQGSGVGDNCFETDGAEASDAQPRTTATIYNATVIGQPVDGDYGTAWRDNARVQYRNCVFMDLGDKLVKNDGDDGDGAEGYGYNGTHTFASIWTTSYSVTPTINLGGADPAVLYQAQTSGNLAEITDSVFYDASLSLGDAPIDLSGAAYNNVVANTADPVNNMPIDSANFVRHAAETKGGKIMLRVTKIDPRAKNAAATSVSTAPVDGFFTPAPYRGAFSPSNNWLLGWSAADAYGFLAGPVNPADPTETIALTATTSYPTVTGVLYSVESSSDNVNWSPVATVVGTGSTMSYTDLAGFDSAKFYRAIAQ